jgi:hypothetical protein
MCADAATWKCVRVRCGVQEASLDALQRSGVFGAGVPLVTQIVPAATFWHAAHTIAQNMRCDAMRRAMPFLTRRRIAHLSSACVLYHRPAEQYHQDYYTKKNSRYKVYRSLSGRDAYIESVWGEAAVADHAVSM